MKTFAALLSFATTACFIHGADAAMTGVFYLSELTNATKTQGTVVYNDDWSKLRQGPSAIWNSSLNMGANSAIEITLPDIYDATYVLELRVSSIEEQPLFLVTEINGDGTDGDEIINFDFNTCGYGVTSHTILVALSTKTTLRIETQGDGVHLSELISVWKIGELDANFGVHVVDLQAQASYTTSAASTTEQSGYFDSGGRVGWFDQETRLVDIDLSAEISAMVDPIIEIYGIAGTGDGGGGVWIDTRNGDDNTTLCDYYTDYCDEEAQGMILQCSTNHFTDGKASITVGSDNAINRYAKLISRLSPRGGVIASGQMQLQNTGPLNEGLVLSNFTECDNGYYCDNNELYNKYDHFLLIRGTSANSANNTVVVSLPDPADLPQPQRIVIDFTWWAIDSDDRMTFTFTQDGTVVGTVDADEWEDDTSGVLSHTFALQDLSAVTLEVLRADEDSDYDGIGFNPFFKAIQPWCLTVGPECPTLAPTKAPTVTPTASPTTKAPTAPNSTAAPTAAPTDKKKFSGAAQVSVALLTPAAMAVALAYQAL